MKLRFFVLLTMVLLAVTARGAALPVSKMQNAMSGVTQSKMQSRGFASNDPRYNGTLAGITAGIAAAATQAATVTALGVTAPAWATVAAGAAAAAAVGAVVYFAIDAGLKWLLKDGNTVQVGDNPESVNTPAGMAVPSELWCYGKSCSASKATACSGKPGGTGSTQGRTYSYSYTPVGTGCNAVWTYSDTGQVVDVGATSPPEHLVGNRTVCPGIGLSAANSACPASNFPEPAGAPVKTISDAAAALSDAQKAAPLNPQIIADLANEFWRSSASAPGYNGLPYDATNPVTSADVATWQAANPSSWPSVGDFVAPQPAPSGGSASSPFTMPTSSTPVSSADPATQPSTGTNPSTEPLQNLGPDPGIGAPGLEPIPTAQQIIAPLTNAFPSVKSFVVPNIDAQCPTWAIPVFGKDIGFTNHCALLEQTRPTLFAAMAVVYAFMALFIVLRA